MLVRLFACMRVRLAVAVLSFTGFVVFLVVVLVRPPPSVLLPNLPQSPSRKVSVILFPTDNNTHLLHTSWEVVGALSKEHLEAEFLVALPGGGTPPSLHPLQKKGHHVQGVNRYGEFSRTLLEAFDRAHFSLILVLGDTHVPLEQAVPQLVGLVAAGQSDITLAQHTDDWWPLGLLSYPLTLSTSGGSNTSVFCLHKAVWMKACQGVSPHAASISLELLAKCRLRHSIVALQLGDKGISRSRVLRQILRLYWELHPLLLLAALSLPVLFCGVYVRTSLTRASHLSITHTV